MTIRGILLIIITITSYYVITAGYNAFMTMRQAARVESFTSSQQGKCHDIDYASFQSMCINSIKGPGANRPYTPQMNLMNAFFLQKAAGTRASRPTPTDANQAFLRLLKYINPNRNATAVVPFRDMIKCLFFTCDSYVIVMDDMTKFIESQPILFSGAQASVGLVVDKPNPAQDLRVLLSYLDTRRTTQEDPAFFNAIRTLFMANTATLRNDIEFGRLAQLVNPDHVFRLTS